MNGATPIAQLIPEMQQRTSNSVEEENMPNYQDVLKNLDNTQPQSSSISQNAEDSPSSYVNNIPPTLNVPPDNNLQYIPPVQYQKPTVYASKKNENMYEFFSEGMQQDIALILISYVIIHSDFVQKLLKERFQNMYIDNKVSTFGIVSHAILLVIVLYIGKMIKEKYVKMV